MYTYAKANGNRLYSSIITSKNLSCQCGPGSGPLKSIDNLSQALLALIKEHFSGLKKLNLNIAKMLQLEHTHRTSTKQ